MSVSKETIIAAPPERVWAALVTFADYAKWHPMVRIDGEPESKCTAALFAQNGLSESEIHDGRCTNRDFRTAVRSRLSFWARDAAIDRRAILR
ncbi:MAG: SRPBCC family protein [Sphingomonadales bacterium]|nr:SRPBCC family protein [Sphingomonadales bacterium]